MTDEQCGAVSHLKTIGVNDAYRRARLDILYACDGPWWEHYSGVTEYTGIKVTQDEKAARKFGLFYVRLYDDQVLCREPGYIAGGGNSGYQAINIAYHLGAKRLILLGYDMGGSHWMKKRPDKFNKNSPFKRWIDSFNKLSEELKAEGIEVINCSPNSALECFQKMKLSKAL